MINDAKEKQAFKEMINNELFPAQLAELGEEKLYSMFQASPAQFTVNVLHSMAMSTSKWDTEEGQNLLAKLKLTKADVLRYSK